MKKNYLIKTIFIFLLFAFKTFSQVIVPLVDSNLPIVLITTDGGAAIPDDPKILGTMKIIKHPDGSRNFMTDQNTPAFLNYSGRIGIEVRGSSSQSLPKKPYSLTTLVAGSTTTATTANVSILGMPSESDWVLNSLAFDQSLIRDYLAYNLSRQMGNYAVKTEYCEVVVNGEYKGLYMLTEKIKADSNRVDITKIAVGDNALPNLSGGYITKADKTTGGDPVAWSMAVYGGANTNYIHELPKPIAVTANQNTYIKSQFDNLQAAVTANNVSLLNGYTTVIDVPSFVDFMVSNEYFANVDGYQLSTFFHKDRNGKLRAGPIWDFNLTMGNDLKPTYDRSFTNTWQFSNGDNEGSKFWTDLFNNTEFKCYFAKRWFDLTQTGKPLNQTSLNTLIDGTIVLITEAMAREQVRWNTIPNNALEISNLKTWVTSRITWVNANIGSPSACLNVVTPPLVITKINYNPTVSGSLSSNNQEFVQITNTGSTPVNLSGIYFLQLGTTYQFPYNSTVAANTSIYLAANATVFQTKNGIAPFGQYSRNLSNTSQNIVLADAFGNIIDRVEYSDTTPWPTAADGNGSYLQLISTNLDNNLASSWVATPIGPGLGVPCCN
jgi:CotH kinase protein/Lamin Tail Domain